MSPPAFPWRGGQWPPLFIHPANTISCARGPWIQLPRPSSLIFASTILQIYLHVFFLGSCPPDPASMAAVSEVEIDGVVFPPVARPPGSGRTHFLAGAGVRGADIAGNFIKFTAIGVYLQEDAAVPALAKKWAGKSADELADDAAFFRDVVTGDFEKFTRVTMIVPLTGEQYSGKVTENCVAAWKAAGVYTDAEGAAADKFKAAFKPHSFPPGASILFTHSPAGVLTVAFSKDSSVPEDAVAAAIENRALSEAVLDSIIGEHGVSPAAKRSIAARVSQLLKPVVSA